MNCKYCGQETTNTYAGYCKACDKARVEHETRGTPMPKRKEQFITDFGEEVIAQDESGDKRNIGRYGVWGDMGRGKPEVMETSDDLVALQSKYGDLEVINMKEGKI